MIQRWPSTATGSCHSIAAGHNLLALPRQQGIHVGLWHEPHWVARKHAKVGRESLQYSWEWSRDTPISGNFHIALYCLYWKVAPWVFDYSWVPTTSWKKQSSPPTDHPKVNPELSSLMYDDCPGPWLWSAAQLEPTTICEFCFADANIYIYIHIYSFFLFT